MGEKKSKHNPLKDKPAVLIAGVYMAVLAGTLFLGLKPESGAGLSEKVPGSGDSNINSSSPDGPAATPVLPSTSDEGSNPETGGESNRGLPTPPSTPQPITSPPNAPGSPSQPPAGPTNPPPGEDPQPQPPPETPPPEEEITPPPPEDPEPPKEDPPPPIFPPVLTLRVA